jgi:hypothetical protein
MDRRKPLGRAKLLVVAGGLAALLTTSLADGLVAASMLKVTELAHLMSARSPGERAAGVSATDKAKRALTAAPEERARPRVRKKPLLEAVPDTERMARALQRPPVFGSAEPLDAYPANPAQPAATFDVVPGFATGDAPFATLSAPPAGGVGGGFTGGGLVPVGGEDGGREPIEGAELVSPPASSAVPEPATWLMLFAGFGLMAERLRRVGRLSRKAGLYLGQREPKPCL